MALEARALFPKEEIVSWDVALGAWKGLRLGFSIQHGSQWRRLDLLRESKGCSHLPNLQGGEMIYGMCGALCYFSKVVF